MQTEPKSQSKQLPLHPSQRPGSQLEQWSPLAHRAASRSCWALVLGPRVSPRWATLCSGCCPPRAKEEQLQGRPPAPWGVEMSLPRGSCSQGPAEPAGRGRWWCRPPAAFRTSSSHPLWPPSQAVSPGTRGRQPALATRSPAGQRRATSSHSTGWDPPHGPGFPRMQPRERSLGCPTATLHSGDLMTSPGGSSLDPIPSPAREKCLPRQLWGSGQLCPPPAGAVVALGSRRGAGQVPSPLPNRRGSSRAAPPEGIRTPYSRVVGSGRSERAHPRKGTAAGGHCSP